MLKLTSLFKAAAIVVAVLLTVAAAAAPASQDTRVIKTFLRPDLSLQTMISPDFFYAGNNTPKTAFLRTCRCSCGYPCKTNADCGPGGVCAAGITCCATAPGKDATNRIFQEREALSSRQRPSLIPVSVNCKQK